jgi:hypothetical protein
MLCDFQPELTALDLGDKQKQEKRTRKVKPCKFLDSLKFVMFFFLGCEIKTADPENYCRCNVDLFLHVNF